jgi:hypothetical protein
MTGQPLGYSFAKAHGVLLDAAGAAAPDLVCKHLPEASLPRC